MIKLTKKEILWIQPNVPIFIEHQAKGSWWDMSDGVYTLASDELHLLQTDTWLDCAEYETTWAAYRKPTDQEINQIGKELIQEHTGALKELLYMKIINSKNELYDYLNKEEWMEKKETAYSSVYFLVEYENTTEPIYFYKHDDWWLEYPCSLMKKLCKEEVLYSYVKELYEASDFDAALAYEKSMCRNGWLHGIENFQCSPFLPDQIRIVKVLSETECLDWLLEHEKALAKDLSVEEQ